TTIGGHVLTKEIEKLLQQMVDSKWITPEQKESLKEPFQEALEAAHHNGNVPKELFTDTLQRKKLMMIAISTSLSKDFPDLFNPRELAKSLLSPKETPQEAKEAKENIVAFMLAITPPKPGQ